jgi:hypothetical protein
LLAAAITFIPLLTPYNAVFLEDFTLAIKADFCSYYKKITKANTHKGYSRF